VQKDARQSQNVTQHCRWWLVAVTGRLRQSTLIRHAVPHSEPVTPSADTAAGTSKDWLVDGWWTSKHRTHAALVFAKSCLARWRRPNPRLRRTSPSSGGRALQKPAGRGHSHHRSELPADVRACRNLQGRRWRTLEVRFKGSPSPTSSTLTVEEPWSSSNTNPVFCAKSRR
jgi:hypothetical protein